jgi:hypothetical protein
LFLERQLPRSPLRSCVVRGRRKYRAGVRARPLARPLWLGRRLGDDGRHTFGIDVESEEGQRLVAGVAVAKRIASSENRNGLTDISQVATGSPPGEEVTLRSRRLARIRSPGSPSKPFQLLDDCQKGRGKAGPLQLRIWTAGRTGQSLNALSSFTGPRVRIPLPQRRVLCKPDFLAFDRANARCRARHCNPRFQNT